MLGDLLQLIVIFGHGSALAWDINVLAKAPVHSQPGDGIAGAGG